MTVTVQPSASASSIACFSAPADRSLLPINMIGFCEKSQIQALNRTQPGLPMKKGRAGHRGE